MARRKVIQLADHLPNDYRWITKDPIIDKMMALAKRDGRSLSSLAVQAWLSPTTVHNWYAGKTKKPNHVSVEFFLRAMGYRIDIVKEANPKRLPIYRWRSKK